MRCEVTWNPGIWPYVARCPEEAVRRVQAIRDNYMQSFEVCEKHGARLHHGLYSDMLSVEGNSSLPLSKE